MIRQLHQKLLDRHVTAVELANKAFEAIDARDPETGAFLRVMKENALRQATDIDHRIDRGEEVGLLAGIPCAVKDNMCVRGEITTAGSKILENYRAPYNATVVDRILEEGAVIVGKTNMDEFAMGSSTESSAYQVTRNPIDPQRVPGGSSGGSAAAVASDEVVWSLGSDTGGSIRQPASFCGIVGLKPTYGRVSRHGLLAMASSLDQIGPFARTVEDAAIVLSVISGEDRMDATTAQSPGKPYDAYLNGNCSGLTIGVPKEYVENTGLDPRVKERFEQSLDVFRKSGATIESISLPHAEYALPTYYIIMPSEVSSNLARFDGIKYGLSVGGDGNGPVSLLDVYRESRRRGFGSEVKRRVMLGTYALSAGYYDAYYKRAQKVRALIRRDFERAFGKVDLIYGPTSPEVAFKFAQKTDDPLKMYLSDIYTVTANIAGVPAVSFPIGTVSEEGKELPAGGQLMAKWFDEENLLRAADAYERNKPA